MSETKIKNWDGKEFTLDELSDLVDESNDLEIPFDEMIDGDEATPAAIIKELIERIKWLEHLNKLSDGMFI